MTLPRPAEEPAVPEPPAAPPEAERHRVVFDISLAAIGKVVGTLILLWLLVQLWPVVLWLLFALMFVAALNPLVRRLQAHIHRQWAITGVALGLLLALAVPAALVIPVLVRQGHQLMANLPTYTTQLEQTARKAKMNVNLHDPIQNWMEQLPASFVGVSMTVTGMLVGALTVFTLTLYLLIEGPQVATSLLGLLPKEERLPIRRMCGQIGEQVGGYMRGQLITSVLAGLFAWVTLTVLGIPEAPAMAALMAVADIIPLVGPILGTIPAVLLALTKSAGSAWLVLILYTIYLQVEANWIAPKVYAQALRLSPFAILVALLVGATLLGVVGAIIALPIAAAIPIVMRYYEAWRDRREAAEVALP